MLTFKEYIELMESLDSPYPMNFIPDNYFENSNGKMSGYMPTSTPESNIFNRKIYSIGAAGYITTFDRRGATEIHHVEKQQLKSDGKIYDKNKPTPNPRFVATMFHHAKSLLDDGHIVRVVGYKAETASKYHRLSTILAKKHGYVVSDMSDHVESPEEYAEFTVSKPK